MYESCSVTHATTRNVRRVVPSGQSRGGYQSAPRTIRPCETGIAARPFGRKRRIFGRVWLYRLELLAATHLWLGEPEEESVVRGSTRGPGRAGSDSHGNSERRPEVRSDVDTLRSRGSASHKLIAARTGCLYQFLGAINILHMRDGNRAGGQGVRRYHAGRCKGATLPPEADLQGDSQHNVK
ncbi:hypothetical protein NDU88_005559 [Pleurodeles waltl]|uniref:Uncharacterized protein n=1 Tax=Pleurodeles waltl TaxID=8319 RepID=A0AAV7VJC0_PLEWA|nr:hypothetical protein NDU88_005559 [Pleurodeles waltl]